MLTLFHLGRKLVPLFTRVGWGETRLDFQKTKNQKRSKNCVCWKTVLSEDILGGSKSRLILLAGNERWL